METRARVELDFQMIRKNMGNISISFLFPPMKNHSRIVRFCKLQSEIFLERVRQRGVHFLEAE